MGAGGLKNPWGGDHKILLPNFRGDHKIPCVSYGGDHKIKFDRGFKNEHWVRDIQIFLRLCRLLFISPYNSTQTRPDMLEIKFLHSLTHGTSYPVSSCLL